MLSWADRIAHIQVTEDGEPFTWGESKSAISSVGNLLHRYSDLFAGAGWRYEPMVSPSWKDPFTRPLFQLTQFE